MPALTAARELKLGPRLAGIPLSPDEFDAVEKVDDRYRYELINGVLIVSPLPLEAERDSNEELGYLLRLYKETHRHGSCLDKTLHEQTVQAWRNRRRPDRVLWVGLGRVPDPEVDVPNVVAEFVSRGRRNWRRDYVTKRREYQQIGVEEYWIFNRFDHTLTVFRFTPDGLQEIVLKEHQTYRTPLLPGFRLPLARIFAVADSWKKAAE